MENKRTKQIERILHRLRFHWHSAPDLRLGQLLTNAAHDAGWETDDMFYAPDEVFEKGLAK